MDAKQQELYDLMSDISEQCYFAGWMSGNEFTLWAMVVGDDADRRYGVDSVADEDISALRKLAADVGGWIRWVDDEEDPDLPVSEWGPRFTPMAEWLDRYKGVVAARRSD